MPVTPEDLAQLRKINNEPASGAAPADLLRPLPPAGSTDTHLRIESRAYGWAVEVEVVSRDRAVFRDENAVLAVVAMHVLRSLHRTGWDVVGLAGDMVKLERLKESG